jgi:GTP cyclohydrolase I
MSNFEDAKGNVRGLLSFMGEDVSREGLADTPRRVVEMYQELTEGYALDPKAIINKAIFEEGRQELVVVRDIPFYSLCEHHLAPFFGTATIGYIPSGGKVVGLSKLARVLDAFAKRLQVQERLGAQIAEALYESDLRPNGVGVYIQAEHLCMAMRGVQKPGTSTVTNTTLGWLAPRTIGNPAESEFRNQWMQTVQGR